MFFIPTLVALLVFPIVFFKIVGVDIALPLCKLNAFLCRCCIHNTLSMLLQIMENCLKTCGVFVLPGCLVVTQILSEFITCLGALFQEYLCEVPFLCIPLNFNLLIIGDVLIR